MNKEELFLNIIKKNLKNPNYLGDDCAYLKDLGLVITQDTLVQNVHFSLSYMTHFEIGKKAVIVNISDILAMGAKPLYITVSISGNLDEEKIDELYKGINEECEKYNVTVIGGDLTKARDLTISICAIGSSQNLNVSSRKNAKENYIVGVVGEFGSSEYYLLTKNNDFKLAHTAPALYPKISSQIAKNTKHHYAMMDSSDGLMACLFEFMKQSNVGFQIEYNKIPHRINNKDLVLYGGEDFCLVCCLHQEDFKKIKGITKIGHVIKDKKILIDNIDYTNKEYKGYTHFE